VVVIMFEFSLRVVPPKKEMEDVDAPEEYQHNCVIASSTLTMFWNRFRSVKIITDMQKSLELAKDGDTKDDQLWVA